MGIAVDQTLIERLLMTVHCLHTGAQFLAIPANHPDQFVFKFLVVDFVLDIWSRGIVQQNRDVSFKRGADPLQVPGKTIRIPEACMQYRQIIEQAADLAG